MSAFVNKGKAVITNPKNTNGLDVRLQLGIFMKHVLLDMPLPTGNESITFDWRRNSEKEPVFDTQGQVVTIIDSNGNVVIKEQYYPANHTLGVFLTWQRP